jgi:hypothetical protein
MKALLHYTTLHYRKQQERERRMGGERTVDETL